MINFNIPPRTGDELKYIEQAINSGKICGDGEFTRKATEWLEQRFDEAFRRFAESSRL